MPKLKQQPTKWPKYKPAKTKFQNEVDIAWQAYWFDMNKNHYSAFINFGHGFARTHSRPDLITTLEVGAGVGDHFNYEVLSPEQKQNYWVNELSPEKIKELKKRWPFAQVVGTDCQARLPFKNGYFDRILAIHVLEHLENLPVFLREADRLLSARGRMIVVLPCEGWAYNLIRYFTSQRLFESRYAMDYRDYLRLEHVNELWEVLEEVRKVFEVKTMEWWPFKIPWPGLNFCVGMTVQKKNRTAG